MINVKQPFSICVRSVDFNVTYRYIIQNTQIRFKIAKYKIILSINKSSYYYKGYSTKQRFTSHHQLRRSSLLDF